MKEYRIKKTFIIGSERPMWFVYELENGNLVEEMPTLEDAIYFVEKVLKGDLKCIEGMNKKESRIAKKIWLKVEK